MRPFGCKSVLLLSRGEDSAALHCEFRDLSEDRKLKHGQTAGRVTFFGPGFDTESLPQCDWLGFLPSLQGPQLFVQL
jgi:hypothetical protein